MATPLTRKKYQKLLQQCFEEAYREYPEMWDRMHSAAVSESPWYKRWWRKLFWSKARLICWGHRK